MPPTVKKKIQMSLDQGTLDLLDCIVERIPDVESRSAAIRWAVRNAVEGIKAGEKANGHIQTPV